VAYHTHPHVDIADTGYRAMKLRGGSSAARSGRSWRTGSSDDHLGGAAQHQPAADGPLMQSVIAAERERGCWPPASTRSRLARHPEPRLVHRDGRRRRSRAGTAKADALGEMAWKARHAFLRDRTPVAEALRIARETPGGPIVLATPATAPPAGGGRQHGPAAGTAGVAGSGPCLLLITDPEAAAAARRGVGQEITLEVGGKLTPAFFQPVRLTGTVRTLSDGSSR